MNCPAGEKAGVSLWNRADTPRLLQQTENRKFGKRLSRAPLGDTGTEFQLLNFRRFRAIKAIRPGGESHES